MEKIEVILKAADRENQILLQENIRYILDNRKLERKLQETMNELEQKTCEEEELNRKLSKCLQEVFFSFCKRIAFLNLV